MKSILITGSTDGIGKLAAMQLAKEGHAVYVHGRSSTKVNATIAEIKHETNNKNIGGFVADFSELDEVKQMAAQVQQKLNKIDVLINNAGVYKSPVTHNKKGYELRFAVNYLAPFILTSALIPLLKTRNDARIINLSSAAQSEVSLDAITGKRTISIGEAYAQSKLALTMWSFYLANELEEIAVLPVNPGSLLNTKMVKEAFGQSWSEPNKGSEIICDLAIGERHAGITGKYFDNDKGMYGQAHSDAYEQTRIKELIDFTNNLIQ